MVGLKKFRVQLITTSFFNTELNFIYSFDKKIIADKEQINVYFKVVRKQQNTSGILVIFNILI